MFPTPAQAQKSAGLAEDHEIDGYNTFGGGVSDGCGVGAEGGSGGGASARTATGVATREGGEGVAGSGLNAIRKARSRR